MSRLGKSADRGWRIGTRGSPLALAQAEELRRRLIALDPELGATGRIAIEIIKTTGDKVQDRALAEIGGKGLFTKELEDALFDRRIDLAVHSMKDMATQLPAGLAIGAYLPREDPRDALIARQGKSLAELPAGAVVGSASLRRRSQILALRPDLKVVTLRGNVGTRLDKLAAGQIDATLLALAGLKRLGLADRASAILETSEMLPAVAQGAIGIEIRAEDSEAAKLLARLDHPPTRVRVTAERACLAVLDGSCRTPIAALAEFQEDGATLRLRALIALPDGRQCHREDQTGPANDPSGLGRRVGQALLKKAGPEFMAALQR